MSNLLFGQRLSNAAYTKTDQEVAEEAESRKRFQEAGGVVELFETGDLLERWTLDQKKHRDDGPAVVYRDGYQEWYQRGVLHRTEGPAIVDQFGREKFFVNGKMLDKQEWQDIFDK